MENTLNILKKIGMKTLKTSFEDEGNSFIEIINLRYLTAKHGLKLLVKIGGAEANSDIKMVEDLKCDGLVVPMVETPYAIKKFNNSTAHLHNKIDLGINLETITAHENIDNILEKCDFTNIYAITIGRVDLIGSIGKSRSEINDDFMFKIVYNTFSKIRLKYPKIKLYLGGSINENSYDFINRLYQKNLLDYVETRYIAFSCKKLLENYYECIYYANIFETQYLDYLNKKYRLLADKSLKRKIMIDSRIENIKKKKKIYKI